MNSPCIQETGIMMFQEG